MNIYSINKRQFEAVMKREGVTVNDYYMSNPYKVFFRRHNRSNSPQGKLRFYYSQDTDISIGTVFTLKGEPYLVISQDALESEIFFTSLAIRCDTTFTVYSNIDKRYIVIPFATVSDKYTISHGSTINIINGSVVCYTGLNDYAKEIKINDEFNNYGGFYKVGNYFYNDNLAYIYLEREANRQDTYSLIYNGVDSLDLSDGTYQLSYTAIKNGAVVKNPSLIYEISDDTIATVSDTGLLTMIAKGSVTVTTVWTDGKDTSCKSTITIVDTSDPDDPNPPVSTGTTVIVGNTNLKNGYKRTYTATFYDSAENEVTGITATWNITDCSFVNEITQVTTDINKIQVSVRNEDLIGESFTLNASDTDGNFTPASITVDIIE